MTSDYLPRPDTDCAAFSANFYQVVKVWWSDRGLDAATMEALEAATTGFQADLNAHIAAQAAATAARETKDAARRMLEDTLRPIARFVQAYPDTTNTDRAAMGLSPRLAPARRVAAPETAPRIIIEPAGRLTHHLRLTDVATPTRMRRPRGADRAEVFLALTPAGQPAPADMDRFRYIGSTSDGATMMTFSADQGGLQAHYLARWAARRGETGPWSAIASQTVAA